MCGVLNETVRFSIIVRGITKIIKDKWNRNF